MSTPAEVSQVFCNILLMRMGWAAPEVSSDEVEGLIEVLSLLQLLLKLTAIIFFSYNYS